MKKIFGVLSISTLALVFILAGCSNATGGEISSIPSFNDDTMTEEFADEWTSIDGSTILVLKDNTFLFVELEEPISPSSARTAAREGWKKGAMGKLTGGGYPPQMQTTSIIMTEEVETAVTSSIGDPSDALNGAGGMMSTVMSTLGDSVDFPAPSPSLSVGDWVSVSEFKLEYIEYYEVYFESCFDYIDDLYFDAVGLHISNLVPGWSSMISNALKGLDIDPSLLDSVYPLEDWSYTITETSTQREMTYVDMHSTDYSFVSDLSVGCMTTYP